MDLQEDFCYETIEEMFEHNYEENLVCARCVLPSCDSAECPFRLSGDRK
jgi:hypothetical protein